MPVTSLGIAVLRVGYLLSQLRVQSSFKVVVLSVGYSLCQLRVQAAPKLCERIGIIVYCINSIDTKDTKDTILLSCGVKSGIFIMSVTSAG